MPAHWNSPYNRFAPKIDVTSSDDESGIQVTVGTGSDAQHVRRMNVVYSRPRGPGAKPHADVEELPDHRTRGLESGLPDDWRPTYRVSKSMAAAERLPPAVGLMGYSAEDIAARADRAWAPAYSWITQ